MLCNRPAAQQLISASDNNGTTKTGLQVVDWNSIPLLHELTTNTRHTDEAIAQQQTRQLNVQGSQQSKIQECGIIQTVKLIVHLTSGSIFSIFLDSLGNLTLMCSMWLHIRPTQACVPKLTPNNHPTQPSSHSEVVYAQQTQIKLQIKLIITAEINSAMPVANICPRTWRSPARSTSTYHSFMLAAGIRPRTWRS